MTLDEMQTIAAGDRVLLTHRVLIYPEGTECVVVGRALSGQILVYEESVDAAVRFYVGAHEIEFPPVVGGTALSLLRDYKSRGRTVEKGRTVHLFRSVVTEGGVVRGYWVHPTEDPLFIFYVSADAVGSPFGLSKPEPRPAVIGGLPRKVRF